MRRIASFTRTKRKQAGITAGRVLVRYEEGLPSGARMQRAVASERR